MTAEPDPSSVAIWDWPVRLFHWSIVVLVPWLWWTWKSGQIELHSTLGLVLLALLVFRLFWGVFGSSTARFASFMTSPTVTARYALGLFRGAKRGPIGHNPLGAWSVVVLLGLLLAQTAFGLFTQDVDGLSSGPLAAFVSYDAADAARHWHGLLFDVLVGFICVHVAAVLFYLLFKRHNLIGPMVTGRGPAPPSEPCVTFVARWRAPVGLLLGAAVAWWVSLGCPPFQPAS